MNDDSSTLQGWIWIWIWCDAIGGVTVKIRTLFIAFLNAKAYPTMDETWKRETKKKHKNNKKEEHC